MNERGAVMLESMLGVLVFLGLFGGGIELLRFSWYVAGMQLIVTNGVRESAIGRCGDDVNTCTPVLSARHVKERVIAEAAAYGIHLEADAVCVRAQGDLNCSSGEDTTGKARELVVVRAAQPVSFFFGLGRLTVRASALARNEPRTYGE